MRVLLSLPKFKTHSHESGRREAGGDNLGDGVPFLAGGGGFCEGGDGTLQGPLGNRGVTAASSQDPRVQQAQQEGRIGRGHDRKG